MLARPRSPFRRLAFVAAGLALIAGAATVAGCAGTPDLAYAKTVDRFLVQTGGAEYEAMVMQGYGAAKSTDGTWTVITNLTDSEKQARLGLVRELRNATNAAIAAASDQPAGTTQ